MVPAALGLAEPLAWPPPSRGPRLASGCRAGCAPPETSGGAVPAAGPAAGPRPHVAAIGSWTGGASAAAAPGFSGPTERCRREHTAAALPKARSCGFKGSGAARPPSGAAAAGGGGSQR